MTSLFPYSRVSEAWEWDVRRVYIDGAYEDDRRHVGEVEGVSEIEVDVVVVVVVVKWPVFTVGMMREGLLSRCAGAGLDEEDAER